MATRVCLNRSVTHPRAKRVTPPAYRDITVARGIANTGLGTLNAGSYIRELSVSTGVNRTTLWSERVASPFTLAGNITVTLWARSTVGAVPERLRVTLSKITNGGNDIETVIGTADSTSDLTTVTAPYTLTIPGPEPAIAIAAFERFILRVYVYRVDLTSSSVGAAVNVGGTTPGADGDSWMEFVEAVTFKPNQTVLSLRRTTDAATADASLAGKMDALPTFGGSAFASAITNTTAGGTLIQTTKTAGGAIAEWVTGRFKSQWEQPDVADSALAAVFVTAGLESNLSANAALRCKVFARDPNGVESLMWDITNVNAGGSAELTTTMTNVTISSPTGMYTKVTGIGEDWRLVFRFYVINAGVQTMGGGFTVSLGYDGPALTTGTTTLAFYDLPDFKAETDPPKQAIPSGGALMGMSNGQ